MNRHTSLTLLLGAALLASCEKNAVQDILGTIPGSARIKFFNFGVNAPGVNFYANETKMTAVLSASGIESTTGTAYGGTGSGGIYSALEPGQYTLTGKIAAATDKDLAIASIATPIADGKNYSFYMSGFYSTATKSVEAFILEDVIPPTIDFSAAYIRFVNAISNSNPMTLYALNTSVTPSTEVAIGGAVVYKTGGAFTPVPTGVYNLRARATGAATDAIIRDAVSFLPGRFYSINARGDITVSIAGTATNRPFLDNTQVR